MIADNLTEFAPAERAPKQAIQRQQRVVRCLASIGRVLDAMPDLCLILNRERQVVCANRAACQRLGLSEAAASGQRPGELLDCVNARRGPNGCGTSHFCRVCGLVNTVLDSHRRHRRVEGECRITIERPDGPEALDAHVVAAPLELDGEDLSVITLTDVSHQKRRRALERVFFHDIVNTAGNVQGLLYLLREGANGDTLEQADQAVRRLLDEIQAQRDLLHAENDELALRIGQIDALVLGLELVRALEGEARNRGAAIEIAAGAESVPLVTDPRLLGRVLHNMLKNAVEACSKGDIVTFDCRADGDQVVFTVHNPGGMTADVQMQVFQRSFSTKGENRGLGTYGMRLLSERYLDGQVTFRSTAEAGTTFTARYPLELPQR